MVFAQFSAIIVSGINQIKYADTKDYTPKCGKERMVHNRIFCRICLKHGRDVYNSYPYAVQRWDMIRYLILYEYGGIYADLDYECIDALDSLLENEFCCLASDPEEHARIFDKAHIVTNAFIAIEAGIWDWNLYPANGIMLNQYG